MQYPVTTLAAVFAAALFGSSAAPAADAGAPTAPLRPLTDTYHGVAVTENYRWLENGADAQVKAWSEAEDARARRYLEALPQRAPIYKRLFAEISASSAAFYNLQSVGAQVFARSVEPPKQQPMIAVLPRSLEPSSVRVIVDPNTMNRAGTTAIDWFVPSPDGKFIAASLSENGSEAGILHVFDVASGKRSGAPIARVSFPTGGGALAWRSDSKGFWYTRYPGPERPPADRTFYQQVYFHELGKDAAQDHYVLGKDFPRVAEIQLSNRFDPDIVAVAVANGDGGEFAHFLIDAGGHIHQLTRFEDKVVALTVGADGTSYLISRQGAPHGRLLKMAPGVFELAQAAMLVPESDGVMQGGGEFGGEPVVVTQDALYVRELMGGPSRVNVFDHGGRAVGILPLPDPAAVNEVQPLGDGTLVYSIETYLRPAYFSRYTEKTAKAVETKLAQRSPLTFADTEVLREMVKSKDGTLVPINIVRRKGTALTGANPLLLYGYGGYNISETPEFLGSSIRLWLDAGGVYVAANLRGGGEFGEDWHSQGALLNKQNVFDDFIACAEHLIAAKYTSSAMLAILGGSNGGLLMGAAMTQRPDLFRAVVSQVGIYDMLRAELDPNGSFNVTEYGSVRDPAQFKALFAYSPYHHVRDGAAYPAVFMQTGATDGRVNPAHSRKMIARLQAASGSGRPVFLSINEHAGHGIGSALSVQVNEQADYLSFLFDQLAMPLPQ